MLYYKNEYAVNGTVDDILMWFEKDMQIIEMFHGEKIVVTFHSKRNSNEI